MADHRQYVAGLRHVSFPLESGTEIQNWRPVMEEDVRSVYDYEAGIVCRKPSLMLFHIAPSEGFFESDAERLDTCLSDTY